VIFQRNTWNQEVSLIGHTDAIECAAFHPGIFVRGKSSYAIVALGSQDRSVSLWVTATSQPFLVLAEAFSQCIEDIRWSSDGQCLYVASYEGSILTLRFEEGELERVANDGIYSRVTYTTMMEGWRKLGWNEVEIDTSAKIRNGPVIEAVSYHSPITVETDIAEDAVNSHSSSAFLPGNLSEMRPPGGSKKISSELITQTPTIKGGKRRIAPITIHEAENTLGSVVIEEAIAPNDRKKPGIILLEGHVAAVKLGGPLARKRGSAHFSSSSGSKKIDIEWQNDGGTRKELNALVL